MFEKKAVVIQKWVKGWLTRRHYRRTVGAIVLLQSCVRRMRAKKELKKLKVEARSVEHFKKLNVGMENKIMQLQHKIDEQVCAVGVLMSSCLRCIVVVVLRNLPYTLFVERHWVFGSCHITCTACVSLPLQQKENRELNEKLSAVEKTQTVEREKQCKEIESLRKSEKEARAKVETLPSLLEQLSFLQHELENTCREKENLEEQTNVYKAQIQQVGLLNVSHFYY